MSQSQSQAKRWLLTINNYTEDDLEQLKSLGTKFIVIAKETAPTTGTPHVHALAIFSGNKRFPTLKRAVPRADLEIVHGTFMQAYKYVTKDGEIYYENGEKPNCSGIGDTFKQMIQDCKNGTVDKECLMFCRYERFFERFLPHEDWSFDGDLKTKNHWIYGPPGTGKSTYVRDYAKKQKKRVYEKLANKWWDNYDGEEIVLIEDIDPKVCELLIHHFKLWADRWPFRAEIKGGSKRILPKFELFVTSNYSIGECFTGIDGQAICRRFEETEKTELSVPSSITEFDP